ncbi:MAG: hypothetical protein R2824_00040 [Saprospiraceae bacterium]|nr:hypothetical protein [Lewinella sp.]
MKYQIFLPLIFSLLSSFQILHAQDAVAWEIQWNYNNVRYDALLWQGRDDNWYMRVRFWVYGGINIIEQRMEPDYDENGLYLMGHSPYFIQASTNQNSYVADNLFFYTNGYTTKIYNLDYNFQLSEVIFAKPIRTLDQYYNIKRERYGG